MYVRTATFAWYIVVGLFLSQLSGELCCFLTAERRSKNCERVVVLVPVAVGGETVFRLRKFPSGCLINFGHSALRLYFGVWDPVCLFPS